MANPTSHATVTALAVSSTELSIISGTSTLQTDTTDGMFNMEMDLSDMVSADVLEIRRYATARASGTKRVAECYVVKDLQGADSAIWASAFFANMHGFDWTLKATAGTINIDATIYKVA